MAKKNDESAETPAAEDNKSAGPKLVFAKNVWYKGKNYLAGKEVPPQLLKDEYIKQYVTVDLNQVAK